MPAQPPDTKAFEDATLPYLPDVRRYALRLTGDPADADDLVQATYLNALRGWHTFRTGSDARKWLFAICRNYFLRQRQRARDTVSLDSPELDAVQAAKLSKTVVDRVGSQWMTSPDLGPAIDRAIADLPEHYRMAVMLVDVEGWSYEDAAKEEAIPIGTLRSRLFRGRRILQERLLEHARDRGFTTAGSEG
jgi:RNA polymerase sigma-70 factor, ECF subfamily